VITAIECSLTAIYLAHFLAYMFSTSLGEHKARGMNKIFLAITYLSLAVVIFVEDNHINPLDMQFLITDIFLLTALLFTCIGDIVLLFNFNTGAFFFGCGNILLFVHEIMLLEIKGVTFADYWWFLIIYVALLGGYFTLEHFSTHFKISKEDRVKAFLYLFLVSMHGSIGLTAYFVTTYAPAIVMGIGSFMFMMSDYVLCSYKYSFNHEKSVHKLNTFLYFAGILLLTWSLAIF